jgi:hypothetical protein
MMSKERAQYILQNTGKYGEFRWAFESPLHCEPYFTGFQPTRNAIHEDGITPAEFEFVRCVWQLMAPTKSFFDAVKAIAEM